MRHDSVLMVAKVVAHIGARRLGIGEGEIGMVLGEERERKKKEEREMGEN